jgi:phospholipid/cholesterol/gamma-HCH transport system substrate-binding protein
MIARSVKIQVLAFAIVSVLGITFVGFRYVGLGDALFGGQYTVRADFARSGGIFTNAAVTYRGVQVGRVGDLSLRPDGVRVDLKLDGGTTIPANTRAVVSNRSAVGEQYVDLRPDTESTPYLGEGSIIPMTRTGTPLPVEDLLVNLDKLVGSVNQSDLSVVIDELGTAFDGTGQDLQRLLDSGDLLLAEANDALPQTLALIEDGKTVLDTQAAAAGSIKSWAKDLASLSEQLKDSDTDLRRLLTNGPVATREVSTLLDDLQPSIGYLLGNLVVVGQIHNRRVAGVQQILATYPAAVAGGYTVVPGDGTAHFGLVLNPEIPKPCVYQRSRPLTCSEAEQAAGSSVRGANNAPAPTGPAESGPAPMGPAGDSGSANRSTSANRATVSGYDPATGLALGDDGRPIVLGTTGGQQRMLGEQAWKSLLLAPLAGS